MIATAAMAATFIAAQSFAQQPPPAKAQPKGPAPKAQPKGPPAPATQSQPGEPQLVFSPWSKVCPKSQDGKAVCLTGKDGAVESGMTVIAAVVIEPEGDPKKTLRITLPLGMALQPGTRVVIDQGQPMSAPYSICMQTGCMADYEASGELIGNLKKGKGLAVQGLNGSGQVITLVLPLTDFAKAYDGPPVDPKVFEDQQRKRFDEMQKRYEENQKKQQQQQ
jgi:invasion protein IalB